MNLKSAEFFSDDDFRSVCSSILILINYLNTIISNGFLDFDGFQSVQDSSFVGVVAKFYTKPTKKDWKSRKPSVIIVLS